MDPSEAATAAAKMSELFHGVEPEHAAHWAKEFKAGMYRFDDACRAMDQLRTATNFFDPERFHAIHRRIRSEQSDAAANLRRSQEKLSERSVQDWWLAADTCIDAMPDEEFYELANIALIEVPENIRERFSKKDLRTIRSIRGRVFELWESENTVTR